MRDREFGSYDPWMNGDASWIDGKHEMKCGWSVGIDTRHSFMSAVDEYNRELFHLQGDEADNMIKEIAWHWSRSECTMDVAVEDIVFAYVNEVVRDG